MNDTEIEAERMREYVGALASGTMRDIYVLAGSHERTSQDMAKLVFSLQERIGTLQTLALEGISQFESIAAGLREASRSPRLIRALWVDVLLAERECLKENDEKGSREIVVLRDLLRVVASIVGGGSVTHDLSGNREQLIAALREHDNSECREFAEVRYFGSALDYLVQKKLLATRADGCRVTLCFSAAHTCPPHDWRQTHGA